MQAFCQHLVILVLLTLSASLMAQKSVTTFGLSFKPMIAGSLLNEGDPLSIENNIEYRTDKAYGYSAGMVIRYGFTDLLSIETGLGYTQRNFDMSVLDITNNYEFQQTFGVVSYEVPIQGLVYIQLSKQIFMDAAFGVVFDMFPSDVAVFADDGRLVMEGRRKSWLQGALTANLGWEWRTKSKGAIYLGATYHRTFGDAYGFLMEYDYDPSNINSKSTTMINTVNGNYLTIDLRYFFHTNAEEQLKKKNERKQKRSRR
ncbi:MAG: hypothetical protein ACPGEG_07675 [Salibacteraceae bacterium]